MRGSLAVAALAALALAAAQAAAGPAGLGVAAAGLAAVGAGLALRSRKAPAAADSPAGPLTAAAGLALLALWPTPWGSGDVGAWLLGAAAAAGLLAVAPSGPAQRERLPAGDWARANLRGLAVPAVLLALFVALPLLARGLGGPEYADGLEWRAPYGPLLAALPLLALAGAALLALLLFRSRKDAPAAAAADGGAGAGPEGAPLVQMVDARDEVEAG